MRAEDLREPPLIADEVTTLVAFLDYQRAIFERRITGLDAEALRQRIGPSILTLGGLTKHLGFVEDNWSLEWVQGMPRPEPWASADFDANWDWDFDSAVEHTPDELRAFWLERVDRSRSIMAEALAAGGLTRTTKKQSPGSEAASLRWVLLHLIGEYARHNGHADLISEAITSETSRPSGPASHSK